MATRNKKGKYGMTRPKVNIILGTVTICNHKLFGTVQGEIIAKRDGFMPYLTVQIQSEYTGRAYIINILYEQCEDIQWG